MVEGYDLNVIDDGFPLSAELLRSAKQVELATKLDPPPCRTLVMHIRKKDGPTPKPITTFVDRWKSLGARCELVVAREPSLPWRHEEFYMTHSPDVLAKTLTWLEQRPADEATASSEKTLPNEPVGAPS
jgi:hypothetical protein